MKNQYIVLTKNLEIDSNLSTGITIVKLRSGLIRLVGEVGFVSAFLALVEKPITYYSLEKILYTNSIDDIKRLADNLMLYGAAVEFQAENDLLALFVFLSGSLEKNKPQLHKIDCSQLDSLDIKCENSLDNDLLMIINKRHSAEYKSKQSLTDEKIISILHAAYGYTINNDHRTVPAAGGLYSLIIFLYLKKIEGIFCLYRFEPDTNILHYIASYETDITEICNNQKTVLEANALILYSYLPSVNTCKYGERALFFSLLEAGHSAQNISLMASLHGLGSRSIGAIDRRYTDKMLEVCDGYVLYGVAIY